MNYIHSQPESSKARAYKRILKLLGANRKLLLELETGILLNKKPAPIKREYGSEFDISLSSASKRTIYHISPRQNKSNSTILYLHGGAYIHNLLHVHWNLITSIVRRTGASMVVPDYPLAPENNFRDVYDMLDPLLLRMLIQSEESPLIVMGDSAGGGLALGLLQKLEIEDYPKPPVILLSPWLDVSMSHPDIKKVEGHDILLKAEGLIKAGKLYSANSDPKNPLISPIYGTFKNLGPVSIFTGTEDVLVVDALRLRQLLHEEGIPCNFFEYPGMFHGWMTVVSLPESKSVLDQIEVLLKQR